MTPHNRGMAVIISFILSTFHLSLWAQSTPVYVTPNNPAATGHFDLSLLKKQAIKYDHFEWLWVRDQKGRSGWILKDSALLPLDFSRQAVLGKGEAIYANPNNFSLPQKTLPQSQIVTLVQRQRDWYKIVYLEGENKFFGWVRSRYLNPYSKDAGFLFSTKETHLRSKPNGKGQILKTIKPGKAIVPINTKNAWAFVQFEDKKGYIPMTNIKSRLDVALKVRTAKGYYEPHPALYKQKILEIFSNPVWVGTGAFTIELKEKPEMGSNTLAEISPWQSLVLQGYSIKKWGLSHVPHWGQLWWPETTVESNVELIESLSPQWTKLNASETYHLVQSPVIPGLRFASAKSGVFRSFDGKTWYPIKGFQHGYPIKVSKNGTLFVADQVSFDHGESFQHYIKWDRVFDSIPKEKIANKGPLQIVDVFPNVNNPKQVTLSLRVGSGRYIQIYTPNLGRNWQLR